MRDLLAHYPGAKRTLFRRYHLGGCSSCGFDLEETLQQLCTRSGGLDPHQVLTEIETSHQEDEKMWIEPLALHKKLHDISLSEVHLLDLRTREEFEAVHLPTSQLLTQELMQEAMGRWPKNELLVLIDHQGERSLDAAAYFAGHGFANVKALRGGIDAYSEKADHSLPRYTIEKEETHD
ncbi:MAG: rhodanese-like domain-containing protein [Verrucomicrobia bacterium]|nr:rhodanese-like domain-containing protein [Verrucomicrobiota bacterium]